MSGALTLHDFAEMTIDVVHEDGVIGYLPTLFFPDTREVRVIEGIPEDADHRDAIQDIVCESGYQAREFFFGIRSAPWQIIVGHFRPGQPASFMSIAESADGGYSAGVLASCDWWRIPSGKLPE